MSDQQITCKLKRDTIFRYEYVSGYQVTDRPLRIPKAPGGETYL